MAIHSNVNNISLLVSIYEKSPILISINNNKKKNI